MVAPLDPGALEHERIEELRASLAQAIKSSLRYLDRLPPDVEEAEALIQSMVDNQRVRMEVTDDGLVVYEFPEIIARFKSRDGFDSGISG